VIAVLVLSMAPRRNDGLTALVEDQAHQVIDPIGDDMWPPRERPSP